MPPCDESAGNELGEVANVASQRQFDHRDDPTLDPRRIDLDLARRIPTDLEQPCHPASVFAAPLRLSSSQPSVCEPLTPHDVLGVTTKLRSSEWLPETPETRRAPSWAPLACATLAVPLAEYVNAPRAIGSVK